MATITLREYNRENEALIEKGQADQVIAHCRHILKYFPKHIDTYRTLGKAYLESKRYGDAADIFQRVISTIPDDFVSHIGMSIIREDEGNLDAAIWHMERAYEVQPSNIAIQDELRRLFGRRDGLEPPKIRLTRGALARMYAHGHLYAQSIGELRATLAKNPQRLDLQVLLTKMYHLDGQLENAAKISSQIVSKLPYCLEANKILSEILSNSKRKEEAETYQNRIKELDPYLSYTSAKTPDVNDVPSSAVTLQKLEWKPSEVGISAQPEWTASLGLDFPETTETTESVPDWMMPSDDTISSEETFQEEKVSPLVEPFSETFDPEESEITREAAAMEDKNIPDWMKDAGWSQRDSNEPEEPSADDHFDEEAVESEEDEEIAKAEIPEWLREMAPKDIAQDSRPDEPDSLDWLEKIEKPEESSAISSFEEPSTPAWLDELASEKSTQEKLGFVDEEIVEHEEIATPTEPEKVEEELTQPESEIPDWAQSMAGEASPQPESQETTIEDTELPDWLQDEHVSNDDATRDFAGSQESTGITGWLQSLGKVDEITEELEEPAIEELAPSEDIPEWLEGLEEDLKSEIGQPESLSEIDTETGVEFEEEEVSAYSEESESMEEITEMPALDDDDSALAWLESLAAKRGVEEEELLTQPDLRVETPPEWVQDISEDQQAEEPLVTSDIELESGSSVVELEGEEEFDDLLHREEILDEFTPTEISEPASSLVSEEGETIIDEDAAVAWLESLASEQSVEEDELLTTAEERAAISTDWVQEITEEKSDEFIPETLDQEQELLEPEIAEMAEPEITVQELPSDETEMVEVSEQRISELSEDEEVIMDEDAAMAWLESLASKHGVEEEELLTEPADRTETPPEWVMDFEEPTTPEPEIATAETEVLETALQDEGEEEKVEVVGETQEILEEVEEEMPAWVQEMDSEIVSEVPDEEVITDLEEEEREPDISEIAPESIQEAEIIEAVSADLLEQLEEQVEEQVPEFEPEETFPSNFEEKLQKARKFLAEGNISKSLANYDTLIKKGQLLEDVIQDLSEALEYRYPVDISIWQTIGDAYLRNHRLQDALDAYTKAEDLLR